MGHNTLKNQSWRKDARRKRAEARQEAYDKLSSEEKLARAGKKQREKLLQAKNTTEES